MMFRATKYICPQCHKQYKVKSSLARHLKLECGKEASFKCPFCPYASKQKYPLTSHINFKHPEKRLKLMYERSAFI
ncbi:unnamed protein product [Acanthoscelides obtectus]|uniref:C2H2-type domain-containing protein n=1 Tax=Acanthoscelides obtectus TaxID=200917 RepID=A0A9P0K2P2_ACAOB|nr:unnamed protein product [Acanthoscelides obtectus]CAK1669737.1 Longitudinals lacking protein, isoforms A/B/D/L [Acanthoscelides obtectus]